MRRHLRRFLRDETGTLTIEWVLFLPLLLWCLCACWVFFGAFQADSANVKATYTIADMLSREVNEPITPEFLDSAFQVQAEMIQSSEPRAMRVTAVRFLAAEDAYRMIWSQGRGGVPPLTDANLAAMRQTILPVMYDGEVGILVELSQRHTPDYWVGLPRTWLEEHMVMRPRFAPTLCWSDSNDGPWTLANQTC